MFKKVNSKAKICRKRKQSSSNDEGELNANALF